MSTEHGTTPPHDPPHEEHYTIVPRRVSFDWDATPLHWIPDEPTATHVINVLHLLLPAGERWFVKVFKEGLPLITDPVLRADVKGFMGQEATHSVQHAYVLDHLAAQRLDTTGFTKYVDFLFEKLLGERPPLGAPVATQEWLRFRLAIVAAIEQFTAVLGDWVLHAEGLDRARADEVMLDLLRWHGAEEVEHRAVAFDMYQHCAGTGAPRYVRRVAGMAVTAPVMLYLWLWGAAYLVRHDPWLAGRLRYSLLAHHRAVRKGLLPPWRQIGAAVPRYLRRSYHPSQEGSLRRAVEYLAWSPAARAAVGAVGRAAIA
ncbi:putative metal-dependent hydrolase [Streptomyces sp. YIM 121038]|uniref:metal-dependent hydrolase n=1 Tax=Streptomyces sp. YIM 121038 TaxID=2136401 RepID=UPI001110A9CA|nr:metal-dependent hydrolase [Streptomyces sp. YIM 121038]QCX77727.1 putative metal-dependent hydrolase [Streptomyces sp. YIM 121038]